MSAMDGFKKAAQYAVVAIGAAALGLAAYGTGQAINDPGQPDAPGAAANSFDLRALTIGASGSWDNGSTNVAAKQAETTRQIIAIGNGLVSRADASGISSNQQTIIPNAGERIDMSGQLENEREAGIPTVEAKQQVIPSPQPRQVIIPDVKARQVEIPSNAQRIVMIPSSKGGMRF